MMSGKLVAGLIGGAVALVGAILLYRFYVMPRQNQAGSGTGGWMGAGVGPGGYQTW